MMITHYDMSTGEVIGTDTRDGPADTVMPVPGPLMPRLATVHEETALRARQARHRSAAPLQAIAARRVWND